MKPIIILLLAALFACGAPIDEELGTTEQAYQGVGKNGSGNMQILGTQGDGEPISMGPPRQNRGCSTAQLGGTECFFTQPDEAYNLQLGHWYGIKMLTGWHAGIITDATSAYNDVLNGITNASEVDNGVIDPFDNVNFYGPANGDAPEIVLNNVNLGWSMPATPSTYLPLYVRAVFSSLTPILTESAISYPGTWRASHRCTINIDASDLTVAGRQAVINADGVTPTAYSLLRQAMAYGILACLGYGGRSQTIVTNNTPYSHFNLSRNVYNGSKFFSADEHCIMRLSNTKSGTPAGNAAMNLFQNCP